jgi:hypothetical protein
MRKLTTIATFMMMALLTGSLLGQDGVEKKPDADAAEAKEAASEKAEIAKADARMAAEKAFSKLMTGATLVGNFTVDNDGPVDPKTLLKPDRYELATVNKVKDDVWLFVYVHKGVPIPLTMKVLWAGTTPVLTLDEFTIAGMGTFSARLMFHDDLYAGTWKHGQKGGLMFGRIESHESKKKQSAISNGRVPPPQKPEPEIKGDK